MASPNEPAVYTANDGKQFSKSASEKLDIAGVKSACDAVVQASDEGCKTISDKMKNVQIGKETICVADKSMEGVVEEVETYINSITSEAVKPVMEQVYDDALAAYNKLQATCDQEAEAQKNAHNAQLAKQNESKKDS